MHRNDDFKLPMTDELLTKFNFFELYPFDGGGNFINAAIFDELDDRKIAENILNGALREFGTLPCLDFGKFERWRSIEKSCWLNRCYFIVPLAKYYKTTGREKIAALVKDTILHFIRNYQPPQTPDEIKAHFEYVRYIRDNNYNKNTYEENQRDETDVKYIWYDFQPASRIIHFLYALHFIKKSDELSDAEFEEIIAGIRSHAHLIAISESRFEELESPGNHQSVRGLSLLYAGSILKDDFYLQEGIRICKFHIENDYFADGVLKEISPSYHVFETWHVRDAYCLSKNYNFTVSGKHKEILHKAATFISSIQQPDGYSTVIDDGYALFLQPFLESLPEEIPANSEKTDCGATYFPDAQLAFYDGNFQYVCFDVSGNPGLFSHYHAGKAAFTYFYRKQAIFIDSACCSYDDPAFSGYKSAGSHSSMLVDGAGDGIFEGLYYCPHYAQPLCSGWHGKHISAEIKSTVPEWSGITWNREFQILPTGFEVNDQVENKSGAEKEFTFIFNLDPAVKCEIADSGQALLKTPVNEMRMDFTASVKFTVIKETGRCFINSDHQPNIQIYIKVKTAENFSLHTRLS